VQATLEAALSRIADEPVRASAAGRTDAGVHATGQVVSFRTRADRPADAWMRGTQSLASPGLSVRWAEPVAPDFDARFSATSRRYWYVWLDAGPVPAIGRHYVTWTGRTLSASSMHTAAQSLLGEHDFSSFRAASCQSRTPYRCVHAVSVARRGELVVLDIAANAFLHHMVRNVAGSLERIGHGDEAPGWLDTVLAARRREAAARTAPARGLYLVDVRYGATRLPPGRAPLWLRGDPEIW